MAYPPLGSPRPIHCDLCGGKVRDWHCGRHPDPAPDRVALRDKYVPLSFIQLQEPHQ